MVIIIFWFKKSQNKTYIWKYACTNTELTQVGEHKNIFNKHILSLILTNAQ